MLHRGTFRAAGVADRLLPGAIALGASTLTMLALPGTPAIQNAAPMPYCGTNAFAAPGLRSLAVPVMAVGGLIYPHPARQWPAPQPGAEVRATPPVSELAVITRLGIGGRTHKQANGPIFAMAVLIPVAALAIMLILSSFPGSF